MDDKKIKIDDDLIEDKKKRKKDPRGYLEKISKRRLAFGFVAIILLVLAIFMVYSKKNESVNNLATTSDIDENSYNSSRIMRVDLNQVKSIDFDLGPSDVRIQRSTTNPYIEYTNLFRGEDHAYKLDVSFENGVLKLKTVVEGSKLYMKDKIPIVRIFLPSTGGIEEIKGSITAGDVKIDDLEVKNFDLRIKSGNISLNNGFFQGSIINEAGSIILNKSELSNTKLATQTGNIIVRDSLLGNRLDFETSTGDILVEAKDPIESYNISARLEVGNFTLGNISYRNILDGYHKDNKAKNNISLKTRVGDISFNKGEGAQLEEKEYLTNDTRINDEDDSESEDSDKEETDKSDESSKKEPSEDEDADLRRELRDLKTDEEDLEEGEDN